MFAFSILVRLLLSVALILNGSASAMAAVRSATTHSHHAIESQAAHEHCVAIIDVAEPPMHHVMQSMSTAVGHDIVMHDIAAMSAAKKTKGAPDHCQPEDCQIECTQHCAATMNMISVQIAIIPRAGPMKLLQAGRLSPVLPHLHRPPIG